MPVNLFNPVDAEEFISKWRGNPREVLVEEVAKTETPMTMDQLDELADLIEATASACLIHMVDCYVVPHNGMPPYVNYLDGWGCDWLGKVDGLLSPKEVVILL